MNYEEINKTGLKIRSVLGLSHDGRDGAQVVLADELERYLLQERFVSKPEKSKVNK